MKDAIIVKQLELKAFIGVPEAERGAPQRLTVSLVLYPERGLAGLGDSIDNTVDYFDVCQRIEALALERPRRLIETLAEEISEMLLAQFPLSSVSVELRKYILPNTAHVGVRILRGSEE